MKRRLLNNKEQSLIMLALREKARILSALATGRRLACDLLAAVPREEAACSLEREREARGWERDELRRQLDQCQGDLQLMRAAAQEAANNRSSNERRLVDQLQRLEAALTAEQGEDGDDEDGDERRRMGITS